LYLPTFGHLLIVNKLLSLSPPRTTHTHTCTHAHIYTHTTPALTKAHGMLLHMTLSLLKKLSGPGPPQGLLIKRQTTLHTRTACRVTSPIYESCTACIVGVAGETSAIIPGTDTTVAHLADGLQGLPDAHEIVKPSSTKTKKHTVSRPRPCGDGALWEIWAAGASHAGGSSSPGHSAAAVLVGLLECP
jgi:hypothetical protein